jgi:tetratricopeptide (TPR) repeat protein
MKERSGLGARASSRMKALASIADSNSRKALRRYRKHLAQYPQDELARAEMLSARILSSKPGEGKIFIDAFERKSTSPGMDARILTAEAYYELDCGKLEEGIEDLVRAKEVDRGFGLPYLSLGRYWVGRDNAKARALLASAAELMPASIGTLLPQVQVELQDEKYSSARKSAGKILRRFPFHPKALLAYLWAAFMSAPMKGIPIFLAVSACLFLPYLGPIVLCFWGLLALLSIILLRKTIPHLSILPIVELPSLLGLFFIRWLIWGRIYP